MTLELFFQLFGLFARVGALPILAPIEWDMMLLWLLLLLSRTVKLLFAPWAGMSEFADFFLDIDFFLGIWFKATSLLFFQRMLFGGFVLLPFFFFAIALLAFKIAAFNLSLSDWKHFSRSAEVDLLAVSWMIPQRTGLFASHSLAIIWATLWVVSDSCGSLIAALICFASSLASHCLWKSWTGSMTHFTMVLKMWQQTINLSPIILALAVRSIIL